MTKVAGKCLILASISLSIFVTKFSTYMNTLIPGGCVVYYMLQNLKLLLSTKCFFGGGEGGYRSYGKQRLFPCTILSGWFL